MKTHEATCNRMHHHEPQPCAPERRHTLIKEIVSICKRLEDSEPFSYADFAVLEDVIKAVKALEDNPKSLTYSNGKIPRIGDVVIYMPPDWRSRQGEIGMVVDFMRGIIKIPSGFDVGVEIQYCALLEDVRIAE
jgi:hypothetical protein